MQAILSKMEKHLQNTKTIWRQPNVDWPVIRLHEVLDCYLFAGLKFKQFEQVLGEALHLSSMSQGQEAFSTHTQDLWPKK